MGDNKVWRGHVLGVLLFITVFQLSLVSGVAVALNEINSCTTISSPGVYVLSTSIMSSPVTCISITSSNVIFDGSGYTIDGVDVGVTFGVYVYNSLTSLNNVTVKNLEVTDWYYGTYYQNTQNGNILNDTASSNRYGIFLDFSSSNTLTNNTASSNDVIGIVLSSSSDNNSIANNTASSNGGTGILFQSSSNNSITNNTASNNQDGIYLGYSSDNTLTNNNASLNWNGIIFGSSNSSTLTSNTVNSNTHYGIYFYSSSNNALTSNIANSNGYYGVYLESSSGNTIYNNRFNNTKNFYFYNSSSNIWNTTKRLGANIVGGPYLGGNFWANPSSTGFSQTCTDGNDDGICDSSYTLASGNVDYLPLTSTSEGGGPTPINSCTTISSPGVYVLNTSIINSGATGCINVTASNVIFDGQGYTIDGPEEYRYYNNYGVYVNSSTALTNVTVKNLKVTGWGYGIYYQNAQNGSIVNNNASSKNLYGIFLNSSSNYNTIVNNTANSNGKDGINLSFSSSNTLTNNTANSNEYGISLYNSNNNTLFSNTASSNGGCAYGVFCSGGGIYLKSSSSNTLSNNTASSNSYGIYLGSSSNNTIYNNYFNNTNNFYLSSSSNTWNTTKTFGMNIIGGPYLGGNVWANPSGTGFSETCSDSDSDGLCDLSYTLSSSNIDYLPLAKVVGQDFTPPMWSENQTNTTQAGASVLLSVAWQDNAALSGYFFASNNSGTWQNDSFVAFTGTSNHSNVSKTLNSTVGATIVWAVWANDSSGNMNSAGNFTLTTTTAPSILPVHNLNTGLSYSTIQAAINAPETLNGHTIKAEAGTYNENVNVIKSVNLIGAGASVTIIQALNAGDHVFEITTNWVNLTGFRVRGATSGSFDRAGIYVGPVNYSNISFNDLSYNFIGINLASSTHSIVVNNFVYSNSQYGIGMKSSANNQIINNTIYENGNGINVYSSNNNLIKNNTVNFNGNGIAVGSSNSNVIMNNTAISNNNYGFIFGYSSANNSIMGNLLILNNLYGIVIVDSSGNNTIYNNRFNNTNNFNFVGTIYSSTWNTTKTTGTNIIGGPYLGGNFWANPSGTGFSETCTDGNSDGICDSNYTLASGNVDYLPLAIPPRPNIVIWADKTSYKANDTMRVGLNLSNPDGAKKVGIYIWVDLPSGGKSWVLKKSNVTLPAGLIYSTPAWKTFTLPSIPPGNYTWHAIIYDPVKVEIISESIAPWTFSSSTAGSGKALEKALQKEAATLDLSKQ